MSTAITAQVYARVSTLRQSANGSSLESQAEETLDYCARRGWEIGGSYTDAVSGRSTAQRRGLERALKATCALGDRGALVVYSLSRLARSTADACAILRRLQESGSHLAIVDGDMDTYTVFGRVIFKLFAVIAEMESELIGERVRMANTFSIQRTGYRTQGRVPYGFAWDESIKSRAFDLRKVSVIRAADESLASAYTFAQVADALNSAGVPSPRGGSWSPSAPYSVVRRFAAACNEMRLDAPAGIQAIPLVLPPRKPVFLPRKKTTAIRWK